MDENFPLLARNKKTYKSMITICLMAWTISLSSFYFGYCMVYLGSIPIKTLKQIFGITLSDSVASGLLNGCIPIGALAGSLSSSLLISKVSRRKSLLVINAFSFVIGGLIYIQTFPTLMIFRIFQGFCVGLYSAIAPLIIKQLSPNEISGTLGTFVQLNITIGVFVGLFFTYLLKKITGDLSGKQFWYFVFGLPQITIIFQTLVLLFIFPYDTPKYLLLIGKQNEAKKLIKIIYEEEFVQDILEQKKEDIVQAANKIKVRSGQQKKNSITTVFAMHIAVLKQFCGINAVAIYGGLIARQTTSGQLELLIPSLINFWQALTCFFTSYLLSRFGRKTILQIGTLLNGIACGIITSGFLVKVQHENIGNALVLIGLFTFMAIYGLSVGPVSWLYIADIVQPKMIPYSTAGNWISASIVIILFPIITQNVLDGNPGFLFIFFTVWCLCSFVFNHYFMIETKDKTQKVIREEYQKIRLF